MILDKFSAHKTENIAITAEILDIELIFLPPYSPQLNPIELIRKSIKKVVSGTFIKDQEMFVEMVKTNFIAFPKSKSFYKNWIEGIYSISRILTFILTPEPGFEPGSKAPQAPRISKLPHSDSFFVFLKKF